MRGGSTKSFICFLSSREVRRSRRSRFHGPLSHPQQLLDDYLISFSFRKSNCWLLKTLCGVNASNSKLCSKYMSRKLLGVFLFLSTLAVFSVLGLVCKFGLREKKKKSLKLCSLSTWNFAVLCDWTSRSSPTIQLPTFPSLAKVIFIRKWYGG